MTVVSQRMFGILERWNNNQVTPSLSKPHELSYRSNTKEKLWVLEIVCSKLPLAEINFQKLFIRKITKNSEDWKNLDSLLR